MKNSTFSGGDASSPLRADRGRRPRRGKLLRRLILLVLILVLFWQGPRLLSAFGEWWVVDEPPIKADAILVLDDDSYGGTRCRRGAELYRAGWAPQVVAIGQYLRPYTSLADVMKRNLIEQGVPESAIIVLPHSPGNTLTEAKDTRALVEARGWKSVLIVTSNHQTRRSRRFFRKALPESTEIRVVAARDPSFSPRGWWRSRHGIATVARECIYFFTTD